MLSTEIVSPLSAFATARRTREDLLRQATANRAGQVLKSATSEFSFIRPDSPLTLPYNKSKSFYTRPLPPPGPPPPPPERVTSMSRPLIPTSATLTRRLPEPPPRASTLNRGLTGLPGAFQRHSGHNYLQNGSRCSTLQGHGSRPSSYHYDGESLEQMVEKLKLQERRKKRMNRILEKSSAQFSS